MGCERKVVIPPDFTMSNKIVYVEDVDGKDGLYSADFGDIVALDASTGVRMRLTYDDYFDRHPSYSRYDSAVIFESKRPVDESNAIDLSAPSHIFSFSLKTQNIQQMDQNWFTDGSGGQSFYPFACRARGGVIFGKKVDFCCQVVSIYDYKTKSLRPISDTLDLIGGIRPSENDSLVAYSFLSGGDILDRSSTIEIRRTFDAGLVKEFHKKGWIYGLGDFKGRQLLFYTHEIKKGYSTELYSYDLDKDSTAKIHTFNNMHISDPVFSSTGIFYIGLVDTNDGYSADIYLLEAGTNEVKRVTNDGHQKMNLFYCY